MTTQLLKRTGLMGIAAILGLGLAGCPEIPGGGGGGQAQYNAGFALGFAEDEEYWMGFWDGYDTVDGGTIYYTGHEIPFLNEVSFDAGYWDGVWYAYNDGYFVNYDYAFTIGFSEGYDLAFRSGWRDFLANDRHIEWLDGGWSDGYEDGFSEGRVFGAWEYTNGWTYDWLEAMLDYRDGEDLYVDVYGERIWTGVNGPVFLYEYGTNPFDLVKKSDGDAQAVPAPLRPSDRPAPRIRLNADENGAKAEVPAISYRNLTEEARRELNVRPSTSFRSDGELTLTSTWLERVNAYLNATKAGEMKSRERRSRN